MTLQDLIDSIMHETARQTLTSLHAQRCLLLAYEMGMQAMRGECPVLPWQIRAGNFNLVEEAQRGSQRLLPKGSSL